VLFGQDRNQIRQLFFNAWQKHINHQPREPLEDVIISVILMHPEYHAALEQPERTEDKDFTPEMGESNPFLHMGLHIAIHEQLGTGQPAGIKEIHQRLLSKYQDEHEVEHRMMECLAETLWQAQRDNAMPDIKEYLEKLKRL
jgi:hypothetical protein